MSARLTCKQINNEEVKVTKSLKEADQRPIAGYDMFSYLYATIVAVGRRNVGKSQTIFHIVKECCGPETEVYIFARMQDSDPGYLAFKKWLKDKDIDFEAFTSLLDDEGGNVLMALIKAWMAEAKRIQELEEKAAEKKRQEAEDKHTGVMRLPPAMGEEEEEEEIPEPRNSDAKYRYPDRIVILDDISSELKNKAVESLFKEGRHLKTRVIVGTQYIKDIKPSIRQNTTHLLLYKGENMKKVNAIHDLFDVSVDREDFRRMYMDATKEDYGFLYVDIPCAEYRRKFTHKYETLGKVPAD